MDELNDVLLAAMDSEEVNELTVEAVDYALFHTTVEVEDND